MRRWLGRQDWSPGDPTPHEYLESHFAHQPATVERALRAAGFFDPRYRSVSLFRNRPLKSLLPARLLAAVEAPLQGSLGSLTLGPSVYIAALLEAPAANDTR